MTSIARHTLWALSLTAMVLSMVLSGCGSKGGDGAGAPPVVIVDPLAVACPVGQVNTSYGCLYTATCDQQYPGYGWLPGEARCVPPISPPVGTVNGTSGTFVASLAINDRDTFKLFLQNSGACSPQPYGTIYIGNQNCSNYTGAGYMVFQTQGTSAGLLPAQAYVTVGGGSSDPNQGNSQWTTGGRVLTPSFTANLTPYGTGGFKGQGPYGFMFVVNQGLPGNSYQLGVSLMYNQKVFATGTLVAR